MGWKCYSCGTENAKQEAMCTNCGNTVAAPSSFYAHWIVGAAFFFAVFYLAGTLAGGVIVEAVATPSEQTVLKEANDQRDKDTSPFKSLLELQPDQLTAARAVAVAKEKAAMSAVVHHALKWLLPVVLFIICGGIVGFVSDGVTIVEAGIGSVIGQAMGAALVIHVFASDATSWMAVGIGAVPGAALAVLGAWLGEKIQEKKERAGGITA